jgi:hypothetical protein
MLCVIPCRILWVKSGHDEYLHHVGHLGVAVGAAGAARTYKTADGYRATYQHGQHPAARLVAETDTDPACVFTAAMVASSRLLLVDSNFDEPIAAPPSEVVPLRLPR